MWYTIIPQEKFDVAIAAERLRFYLRLQDHLRMANKIFLNQIIVRNQLEELLQKHEGINDKIQKTSKIMGADDYLYQLHPFMNEEENRLFDFIRRMTRDTKQFNSYATLLLESNKEFYTDMPELAKLYEHLSWWHAKYDMLKDDPNMCLIYVGVKQKKPFPSNIEGLIKMKIEQPRKETLLP